MLAAPQALAAAAAIALRLLLWARLPDSPSAGFRPDSAGYVGLARSFAAERRLAFRIGEGPRMDANRPPVYPVFLGLHGSWLERPRRVLLTQCLLEGATAALVAASAAALGAPALVAGLIYALDPVVAAHSVLVLTETLFNLWLALALYLLLRSRPPQAGAAAASGLALGLAVLTRPIAAYLWLPWAAALAWLWRPRGLRPAACFAAAALALPLCWRARNAAVFGSSGLSDVGGINFLYWELPAVRAAETGVPFARALEEVLDEYRRANPERLPDPFAESRRRTAFALRALRPHPLLVARVHLVGAARMWLGPGLDAIVEALRPDRPQPRIESAIEAGAGAAPAVGAGTLGLARLRADVAALLAALAGWLAACYALAGLGALAWWRLQRERFIALWLVPFSYFALISTGGWCYYRFRVPLWPFVAVAAAAGWQRFRETRAGRPPVDSAV